MRGVGTDIGMIQAGPQAAIDLLEFQPHGGRDTFAEGDRLALAHG